MQNKMFSVTYYRYETYLYITHLVLQPFWINKKKLEIFSPSNHNQV